MNHKYLIIIVFLIIPCLSSCDFFKFGKEGKTDKSENNHFNGRVKRYRDDGSLLSIVSYKDSLKNGLAWNYYKNGKVRAEFHYKDGIKNGKETIYYENGNVYRITQYIEGVKQGKRNLFYEDGPLCAELTYIDNEVMPGLKEYYKTGKLKTKPVTIEFWLIDKTAFENRYILRMQLSDKSKVAKFYEVFEDVDGKYMGKSLIETVNGIGEIVFNLMPGNSIMQNIKIWAERKTSLRNPEVISCDYKLAIKNKKRF